MSALSSRFGRQRLVPSCGADLYIMMAQIDEVSLTNFQCGTRILHAVPHLIERKCVATFTESVFYVMFPAVGNCTLTNRCGNVLICLQVERFVEHRYETLQPFLLARRPQSRNEFGSHQSPAVLKCAVGFLQPVQARRVVDWKQV